MTPVSERARTAQRSLLAAVEITAFAAGAHVLAGGDLPAPTFLLAFGAVVLVAAQLTISRVLHVGLVVPFVLAAQVGLHATIESTHLGHGAMAMPMPSTGVLNTSPLMFWAHLVTATATAIVLLLQERAVAVVATWLHRVELAAVPALPVRRSRPGTPRRTGSRRALLGSSPRRGPPHRYLAATS